MIIRFCLLAALVFVLAASAAADWINLSGAETAPNIAEIYILDDHVKLVLEVYVGDLETFDDLVPDDWRTDANDARPQAAERLKHFSEETFRFIDEKGNRLQAKIQLIEPRMRKDRQSPFAGMINPITRQRVPEPPADKRVLYAELTYPFADKPRELTIIPPQDEQGRAQVSIGFIAYHKAVPIIDFRYLGAPARLTLDWNDPWYTKFDNPNLKRHHKSALMSFLYVEPYEVRHEILTRVKDLEQWMDLALRGDEYIELDELEPLKRRIGEFMLARNPVRVDGKALKPILDRSNYVKVSLTGIQLIEKPQRLEVSTAIVGVIITYLTGGLPREVTVDWELFTDQIQRVPATAIDPAGPLITYLEPQDKRHTWTNFLKNYTLPTVQKVSVAQTLSGLEIPIGTVLCLAALLPIGWRIRVLRNRGRSVRLPMAGAVVTLAAGLVMIPFFQVSVARPSALIQSMDDPEAKLILHSLLKNVYRAFDFREEVDVYDKLALSVEGDLLADIYLQNRRSFAVQKAGGAQAKIKQVEVLEASAERAPERPSAFAIRSKWSAMGTVGHWGHVHMRENLYEAIVTVQAIQGHWKIMGLELLEERRVDPSGTASAPVQG